MKSSIKRNSLWVCLGLFAVLLTACGGQPNVDAKLLELRQATLLTEAPAKFVTVDVAKKSDLSKQDSVTIEGCVDLTLQSDANKDKAIFVIREVLENDHGGSEHDPANCPFCKRRLAAAAKAAVAIVDKDDKVLPYGAVELLGSNQGDLVIVQGKAKLDKDLDILRIRSSNVHVRKQP